MIVHGEWLDVGLPNFCCVLGGGTITCGYRYQYACHTHVWDTFVIVMEAMRKASCCGTLYIMINGIFSLQMYTIVGAVEYIRNLYKVCSIII